MKSIHLFFNTIIDTENLKKLKQRWGITSNLQLVLILIVFTINGSISGYLMKPVLTLIGITTENLPWFFYWPLAMILILPVYLAMIVVIGALFGQYRFFSEFSKKTATRIGFGFLFKKK